MLDQTWDSDFTSKEQRRQSTEDPVWFVICTLESWDLPAFVIALKNGYLGTQTDDETHPLSGTIISQSTAQREKT